MSFLLDIAGYSMTIALDVSAASPTVPKTGQMILAAGAALEVTMTDRYDELALWIYQLKVLRSDMKQLDISEAAIVDRRYWRAYLAEADRMLDDAVAWLEELEETR